MYRLHINFLPPLFNVIEKINYNLLQNRVLDKIDCLQIRKYLFLEYGTLGNIFD